jgi:hypothetical protein
MFFLLAMGHVHRLIKKAQEMGLLSTLSKGRETYRSSLYADDAPIFIIKPDQQDFNTIRCILRVFADASGLQTNMDKT